MGRATYDCDRPPAARTAPRRGHPRPGLAGDGVLVAHALDEALALAPGLRRRRDGRSAARSLRAALPLATHQVLTEVHPAPEGDTHYPDFDRAEWGETRREPHDGFDFVWWERC